MGKFERLSVLPVDIVVCLEEFPPPAGGKYSAPNSVFAEISAASDFEAFKTGRRDISSLISC